MVAIRHLGFSKLQNFSNRLGSEGHYESPWQILSKSVEQFGDIALNGFQNGGYTPSCIFLNLNF